MRAIEPCQTPFSGAPHPYPQTREKGPTSFHDTARGWTRAHVNHGRKGLKMYEASDLGSTKISPRGRSFCPRRRKFSETFTFGPAAAGRSSRPGPSENRALRHSDRARIKLSRSRCSPSSPGLRIPRCGSSISPRRRSTRCRTASRRASPAGAGFAASSCGS